VDLAAFGGSALVGDGEVPKDRDLEPARIPSTYVPARNTIFLSLALAWAEVVGAEAIVIGINALDYSGYPDCRPEYLEAFERLAALATRPASKGAASRARAAAAPVEGRNRPPWASLGLDYGLTHSCYDPAPPGRPCGRCDSCRLRARGFAEAGLRIPLLPETHDRTPLLHRRLHREFDATSSSNPPSM
jgi:7-cyano-7-deazaguanine synthase